MMRRRPIGGLLLCASAAIPAGCELTPTYEGEVDLVIGQTEGPEAYIFSEISGVAADSVGNIYVADRRWHQIRIFDSDGTIWIGWGVKGEGENQFDRPCCPAVAPDGRLWVRDLGNERLTRYDLLDIVGVESGRLPIDQPEGAALAPPIITPEGYLYDWVLRFDSASGESRPVRRAFGPGAELEEIHTISLPPGDEPFTLTADGGWATAVTTPDWQHVVDWTLGSGEGEGEVVRITPKRRGGGAVQVVALYGDAAGRLWVERPRLREGDPRRADVFDRSGELVAHYEWPSEIDLAAMSSPGAPNLWLGEESVIFARQSDQGVWRVHRLRFAER